EDHDHHRRLLRSGQLFDVRARLFAALPVDVAGQPHLGHGRTAGGIRAGHGQGGPAGSSRRELDTGGPRGVRSPHPRTVRGAGRALLRDRAALGRRDHRSRSDARSARSRPRRRLPQSAARIALRPLPDVSLMSSWVSESVDAFDTVLVANRGEIARRIIRTLHAHGIRSVAVYSDADADAPHVREADEAVHIGGSAAADSYLRVEAIVDAARRVGAQAIHPGYGFLSESAALARACDDVGIVFIGPPVRALDIMGDRARAREHVARHGVPVVPGFSAAGMDDAQIRERADEIGYPLLVKPSAGGGGKGMEIVRSADALPGALATARRVAT